MARTNVFNAAWYSTYRVTRTRGDHQCLAVLADGSAAGGVSSDHSAGPICDHFCTVGCALAERAVGSVRVVVLDVVAEQLLELGAVPDQGAVAELAACGADPSFRVRVRDRRVGRCADDRGAVASEDVVERANELAGAVADQEPDCPVGTHHEVPGGLGLSTHPSGAS